MSGSRKNSPVSFNQEKEKANQTPPPPPPRQAKENTIMTEEGNAHNQNLDFMSPPLKLSQQSSSQTNTTSPQENGDGLEFDAQQIGSPSSAFNPIPPQTPVEGKEEEEYESDDEEESSQPVSIYQTNGLIKQKSLAATTFRSEPDEPLMISFADILEQPPATMEEAFQEEKKTDDNNPKVQKTPNSASIYPNGSITHMRGYELRHETTLGVNTSIMMGSITPNSENEGEDAKTFLQNFFGKYLSDRAGKGFKAAFQVAKQELINENYEVNYDSSQLWPLGAPLSTVHVEYDIDNPEKGLTASISAETDSAFFIFNKKERTLEFIEPQNTDIRIMSTRKPLTGFDALKSLFNKDDTNDSNSNKTEITMRYSVESREIEPGDIIIRVPESKGKHASMEALTNALSRLLESSSHPTPLNISETVNTHLSTIQASGDQGFIYTLIAPEPACEIFRAMIDNPANTAALLPKLDAWLKASPQLLGDSLIGDDDEDEDEDEKLSFDTDDLNESQIKRFVDQLNSERLWENHTNEYSNLYNLSTDEAADQAPCDGLAKPNHPFVVEAGLELYQIISRHNTEGNSDISRLNQDIQNACSGYMLETLNELFLVLKNLLENQPTEKRFILHSLRELALMKATDEKSKAITSCSNAHAYDLNGELEAAALRMEKIADMPLFSMHLKSSALQFFKEALRNTTSQNACHELAKEIRSHQIFSCASIFRGEIF
ncbi:MAG: hypothetical protein ACE365_05515 [Gammaproteobacteria bacterium]